MTFTPEKPQPRAPVITIIGDAGTGKNSLASAIAASAGMKPVMIRCEDGAHRQSKTLELPDALPICKSSQEIMDQIQWLGSGEHDYGCLIVDSASAADEIFGAEVIASGGKNGKPASSLATAHGGYGAGYGATTNKHGVMTKWIKRLNEKRGMMIIYIVHADLETMKLPDVDDYQRWSLRLMSAKNASPIRFYVDDVDAVLHVRLASALRGDDDERKKIVSTGDREIVCHSTAASVTKNGWGITEPLDFPEGSNPLEEYMPKISKPRRQRKPEPVDDDNGDDEKPDGDM